MPSRKKLILCCGALVAAMTCAAASAGPLRDLLLERSGDAQRPDALDDDSDTWGEVALPGGVRVIRNVEYGRDLKQRFDVYLPSSARRAPVIFLVHGGGWRRGDKAARTVIENKVARWVPRGFIVVSVNYRLLPGADPVEQAHDVALALAAAQDKAASWGGERDKFILMGHSAGAHLVALLATSPALAADAGAKPVLGSVLLDSAALDVKQIMQGEHLRLYDQAFGHDPAFWALASPYHVLGAAVRPMLLVCSTRRSDPCPQATAFAEKARAFRSRAAVLEQDLSHREINQRLGEAGTYTAAVERFMATLDGGVARLLSAGPAARR